ncbi:M48 family metallopeptidase [Erysipelotrichaceae bacterium OttesenSCG-928-M19]|nr:M48 family metallopeptidase [Erysipelotrichaceae bacterium OttesenSCG-928-M19]
MATYQYQGYYIELIRKAKNKNIYFKVQSDGSIRVTCPYHVSEQLINEYLNEFIEKINKKYDSNSLVKVDYLDKGIFYYLGKKLEIRYQQANRDYCQINDGFLDVYTNDFTFTNIKRIIDKFIKKEAESILSKQFQMLVQSFNHINFMPSLKIRKMTSKFGVCYYKKASITLSTLLIHYDYECINYVIIHELAHFVQPNHSKKFYYLVEQYVPNYKAVQNKLKNLKIDY